MRQTTHEPPATDAGVFHGVAASFLAAQGFTLVGDVGIVGMYGGSAARYRSGRGLSLWVMFEPYDGAAAWMSCGREWTPQGAATFLSNSYSTLARRFGLDLPLSYSIAKGEQPIIVVEKIVADLKRTLPIVVSKVSMHDLLAIENEEPSGAAVNAMKRNFGEDCARAVDISDSRRARRQSTEAVFSEKATLGREPTVTARRREHASEPIGSPISAHNQPVERGDG